MNKIHPFNRIEQDNNEILESVYTTLEHAIREQDVYEVTVMGGDGTRTEHWSREGFLILMIECAMETLQEHNYFYQKEGIDKYE